MVKDKTAIAVIVILLVLLQVSSKTAGGRQNVVALMTVNGIEKAEGGGGTLPYSDDDLIVALPTGWYARRKRCHKTIHITSIDTRRTVEAQVVNKFKCGVHGCKNNMMHSSPAVWKKLGLHSDVGKVHISCSDA